MGNAFQFVEGFQPSRANKRLIRRHAMIGRNAGKSVHRASRLSLATKQPPRQCSLPRRSFVTLHHGDAQKNEITGPVSILASLGDGFLSCSLPVEFTPSSLRVVSQFFNFVIEKMYPTRLGGAAQEYQYIYLRAMFPDEATAKCSIALMDATNAFFVRGSPHGSEGLQHYSRSLAVVSDRLRGREALADSTLMLIVLLVLQEQMRQEVEAARVHYEGLKKMIQLRGGLAQLEDNGPVALKICKMDICFSLYHGGPISFCQSCEASMQPRPHREATTIILPHDLDPSLQNILLDAMDLASTLNRGKNCPEYQRLDLQMILVSVGCRLLKFQPLESAHDCSETDKIYHVGLLLYMMTLFFQYDLQRVWEFPLVMRRLQDVLAPYSRISLEKERNGLLLWTLLMGSIWAMADTRERWAVTMLREAINDMKITDFDGMLSSVNKLPWVHSIHDEPARSLWNIIKGDS
ncbi:hypothetical protein PFICI_09774 [Pestalotiopsis fici W106-1]|uniref:Transcription factor domain-containing protein n=1 Tax=Pestalotiopsis fici (strain W106-1 / CGMCC3.15140) TaxID=1229662 RepID=W3WX70_PESFW|nr:uncharacterized protein PFICI_09774 [Pestalotiopsis fici W106-1]ETS77712.1 hypothetical protein PFICI_09774 [Pestalotiopsis fici W106-1]